MRYAYKHIKLWIYLDYISLNINWMCTLEIKNNKNTELPFYKHIIQNIFLPGI